MAITTIPLKNIFHLLTYSWSSLEAEEFVNIDQIDSSELVDLFASVLHSGTNHIIRQGLHKDYLLVQEDIPGVRGRINVGVTARKMLMHHGRTHCEFDELSEDCLPNQIIFSTIKRLLKSTALNKKLHQQLATLTRELAGISEIQLSKRTFRTVQLHGNNRPYRFLLNVCELILDVALLSEEAGEYRFPDFIRDEKRMAHLFENFVFNYFSIRRPDLNVKRESISWQAKSKTDPNLTYLPGMKTDISIRFPKTARTLIIDTKFYKNTFQTYYDKESIHSGNLYQIYSYLKNLETNGGADETAEGMLLYPVVDRSVKQTYEMPGHTIHIQTLNLMADWQDIEVELDESLI